jgi:hypothetical protein
MSTKKMTVDGIRAALHRDPRLHDDAVPARQIEIRVITAGMNG